MIKFIKRGMSIAYIEVSGKVSTEEIDSLITETGCRYVVFNSLAKDNQSALDSVLLSRETRCLRVAVPFDSLAKLGAGADLEEIALVFPLKNPFDFSSVQSLKAVTVVWNDNVLGLNNLVDLSELCIAKFTGGTKLLEGFDRLTKLIISEGPLRDLNFLRGYKSLKHLELAYLNNIDNINHIECVASTLSFLELSHLKKLSNYSSVLEKLTRLQTLKLDRCNNLPSFEFVRSLIGLKFFSFVDTDVDHKDLSPCVHLEYVGFNRVRGYNYLWDSAAKKLRPAEGVKP